MLYFETSGALRQNARSHWFLLSNMRVTQEKMPGFFHQRCQVCQGAVKSDSPGASFMLCKLLDVGVLIMSRHVLA